MVQLLMVSLTVMALSPGHGAVALDCKPGVFSLIRKDDCRGFLMCSFGVPTDMPDCPVGMVFSEMAHVCVLPGSIYDDCTGSDINARDPPGDVKTTTPVPDGVGDKCDKEGEITASHKFCHAYLKCMKHPTRGGLQQTLLECAYPQLFSTKTLKCEYFEDVDCGDRKELTDPCDYGANQCQGSLCMPCHTRLTSCQDQPDGFSAHWGKLWSPYFVYCHNNRTVSYWKCPEKTLFHPKKRECVDLDRIPLEQGGVAPNCTGSADGYHEDVLGRCDRYLVCRGGKYLYSVQCDEGTAFDPETKTCVESSDKCR